MAKRYIDETGLKHVWSKIEERLNNFETTEEILWVNCDFNFGTGQAENFSHTYEAIVHAFKADKVVKLVASYGADDEPQHAIGDLIHYREDENALEFAVFVYSNILTEEHALHHFRVVMNEDNTTQTTIAVLSGGGGGNSQETVSPTVTVTPIDGGHRVIIADINGIQSFDVMNGKDGENGEKGDAFTFDDFTAEQLESLKGEKGDKGDKGEQGIQGEKGEPGSKGADGHTPVKGTDYFTEADKTEIVNAVITTLPTWQGGSY